MWFYGSWEFNENSVIISSNSIYKLWTQNQYQLWLLGIIYQEYLHGQAPFVALIWGIVKNTIILWKNLSGDCCFLSLFMTLVKIH